MNTKEMLLKLRAKHEIEILQMEYRHDKEIADIQYSCSHHWVIGMGSDKYPDIIDEKFKQCQICDLVVFK